MEQRDYILREIEKIGQMIMGIIGKLQSKKTTKDFHAGLTLANLEFEEELGMSLEMLARMDLPNLDAFMKNHPELNTSNQENLANLMLDIGEEISDEPIVYLKQAMQILIRIDQEDKTFSIERSGKIDYINNKLKQL